MDGTLEMAQVILHRHETRGDQSGIEIIAAVHEDLDPERTILESIAERHGGTCVVADPSASGPRRGATPINSSLATHLVELARTRGIELEIEEVDDEVVVRSADGVEPTGSMLTIQGVFSLLASSTIDRELVFLTYSLEGLDVERAALLWDATLAVQFFAPARLKTFVPVAGGALDVEAHCGRLEGSARLIVRDGELIVRNHDVVLVDTVATLLDRLDRPIVIFLGAGASASAHIPQGNRYRDIAIENLVNGSGGEAAFRSWLDSHNRWMGDEQQMPSSKFDRELTLERVLREEFYNLSGRPKSDAPTVRRIGVDCEAALDRLPEGRKALRELASLLSRLVVITVNFDELVETDLEVEHTVLATDADFTAGPELVTRRLTAGGQLPILKLHGTISDPASLVANIDETTLGLRASLTTTLDALLDAAERPLTWIWIGCSMRDRDVNIWSQRKDGRNDLQEWWVDPAPPASVADYARVRNVAWAALEQDLSFRQIKVTSDRFLSALLTHARSLA